MPQTVKNKYANCICQTHTPSETPRPYMYKFTLTPEDDSDIIYPEPLMTPDELTQLRLDEQFLEVAIQVYDQKQELVEGLSEEQFMEIVKHVYDTTETVMEGITIEQYFELAKHVYDTKEIILEGLTPEQLLELAVYVYTEHEILLEGYTLEMVAPEEVVPEDGTGDDIFDIFDFPDLFP